MKNRIYVSVIIFILCAFTTYGQDNQIATDTIADKLIGKWFLEEGNHGDTLFFSSTSILPHGWGRRIEIHSNGKFIDAYGSKCGNDKSIYRKKGKWLLESNSQILKTTIPIKHRGSKFKIGKVNKTELVLIEIK